MHPLTSAIRDIARHNPGKAAIRWNCNDFPYGAVEGLINTRALAMQLKGIRAGELVAFHAEPGPETIIAAAALWALGAAALPFESTSEGALPAQAIFRGAAGLMHPEGDYIKAAAATERSPQDASIWWMHPDTGAPATSMDQQQFVKVLNGAEKRFSLSTRTVLGLTSIMHPASLLDLWSVLAAGGTVDLLNDHEAVHRDCLLQHLLETEADLLIVPSTLPQRLGDRPGVVFAQFRDVIIVHPLDRRSREKLADAFPCAIFHPWDPHTAVEDMPGYSPSEFADGNHHNKAKDHHA